MHDKQALVLLSVAQEYTDNLASVAAKTFSSSGLKKGHSLMSSSPSAAIDDVSDTGSNDTTETAATTGSLNRSQQNALALARVAVTGTTAHGIGARREGVDGTLAPVDAGRRGWEESSVAGGGRGGEDDGGPLYPAQEAMRRMIVHMSESDPYPCVLGIPVKPALFATSKVYVFVCFAVISIKLMYDVISGL